MPTKKRREREVLQKAEKAERSANIPAHIKLRIEARKTGTGKASAVMTNLSNNLPKHQAWLNRRGGLLVTDSDGNVGSLSTHDCYGSANDVRADARELNIKALQKMYPQDFLLTRGGPKRIARAEAGKRPEERAIKPTLEHPDAISERTVQDYFKRIRRATRVP